MSEAADEATEAGDDDGPLGTESTVIRGLVVFLFALSVVSGVARFQQQGAAVLPEAAAFVYLTALLVYGVFTDSLTDVPVQAAMGLGLVAYGAIRYTMGATGFWALIAIGGLFILVRNLLILLD